jgi:hypothetical protein
MTAQASRISAAGIRSRHPEYTSEEVDCERFIASPEGTILAKLMWARLGGSERQHRDVAGMLGVLAGRLDEAYLDRWADELRAREALDELRAGVAQE